jgi:hypothetical protein
MSGSGFEKDKTFFGDICRIAHDVYENDYCQFNDEQKRMFRELVVACGMRACLEIANKKDLTQSISIEPALPWAFMTIVAEV